MPTFAARKHPSDLEWINFKGNHGGFSLVPGKGYLYANSEEVTLAFTGSPSFGDVKVTLTKDANANFSGWNLVGNPFPANAYTLNGVRLGKMPTLKGIYIRNGRKLVIK